MDSRFHSGFTPLESENTLCAKKNSTSSHGLNFLRKNSFLHARTGFTLIELLIVIAIVSVLSVIVIVTINPAELLKKSRDTNRLSDMANLNQALNWFLTDSGGGGSMGSPNTVYVSIADPTATSTTPTQCQGVGLPSLPSSWSYNCPASSTLQKVDGTGWIPVNFISMSSKAPFATLPKDPLNTSSTRNYYTYTVTSQNQWNLTTSLEATVNKLGGNSDKVSTNGDPVLNHVYETGPKLGLQPLDYGDTSLVGYWTFDEGSGSTVYDYSGTNATGSLQNSPTWTTGKVGNAISFASSSSQYIKIPRFPAEGVTTWTAWIYPTSFANSPDIMSEQCAGANGYFMQIKSNGSLEFGYQCLQSGALVGPGGSLTLNTWNHVAATINGSAVNLYINGVLNYSSTISATATNAAQELDIGGKNDGYFNGYMDDVRIYNRALSASEVSALYNSTK